jgi:hypothetical protein
VNNLKNRNSNTFVLDLQPQSNSKVQKKINTTQPLPSKKHRLNIFSVHEFYFFLEQVPLRSVISKPLPPLSNPLVDRNNNSVTSTKPKLPATPSVIILD